MGGETLRAWLEQEPLTHREKSGARRALRFPNCWPVDPALAARARALTGSAPPVARPGEVMLVSVSRPAEERVSLWRFGGEDDGPPPGSDAREVWALAQRIVSRDLPVLVRIPAVRAEEPWRVSLLWRSGPGRDEVLHDRSFGLALLLAAASRLMDTAVPGDIVALAEITGAGELRPVGGLGPKLRVVGESALGVRRVLVHPEQQEVARETLAGCGRAVEVIAVGNTGQAFRAVFGDLEKVPLAAWDDPQAAREAAEQLFRMTVTHHALLDWGCVARAGDALVARLSGDAVARERAAFATAIARRHANGYAPIEWPAEEFFRGMSRMLRTKCVAQVVQAASDSGSDALPAVVERARALVDLEAIESEAELELLGALGRALSSLRAYEQAERVSAVAVDQWFGIYRAADASRALCELLRVWGIQGKLAELRAARGRIEAFEAEPGVDAVSRAFVRFAAGRALVTVGAVEEGRGYLEGDGVEWDAVPDYLRRSRMRWLAMALGEGERGEALRARVVAEAPGEVEAALVRLDVARAAGRGELAACVEAVERLQPQGLRWLLEGATDVAERARRVAVEYPY